LGARAKTRWPTTRAPGLRALIKVYDTPGTDLAASPEADDHRSASRDMNLYDREAFEFHSYAPRAGLFYNRNDGFGLSLGLSSCAKAFASPITKIATISTCKPQLARSFNLGWLAAIGKVDLGAKVSYSNYFPSITSSASATIGKKRRNYTTPVTTVPTTNIL
jgi:hypothetical protein